MLTVLENQPILAVVAAGFGLLWLAIITVWLSVIDLKSHLLPNRIVYPSALVALATLGVSALLMGQPGRLLQVIGGGLIFGAGFLLLRIIYPAGMGLGDVKLAVVLGQYLGFVSWWHLFYGAVATFLLGGLIGAVLILGRRASGRTAIPFGPFMLVGTFATLLLPAI